MRAHRWWLAGVAALLMPWIGPHTDLYLPVGWLLIKASAEAPDIGFWVIAVVLLGVAYLVWLAIFTGIGAWQAHNRRRATR
jgi:hypothetical protein